MRSLLVEFLIWIVMAGACVVLGLRDEPSWAYAIVVVLGVACHYGLRMYDASREAANDVERRPPSPPTD